MSEQKGSDTSPEANKPARAERRLSEQEGNLTPRENLLQTTTRQRDMHDITTLREQNADLLESSPTPKTVVQPQPVIAEEPTSFKSLMKQAKIRGAEMWEENKKKYWHLRTMSKVFGPVFSVWPFKAIKNFCLTEEALAHDPEINRKFAQYIDKPFINFGKKIDKKLGRMGLRFEEFMHRKAIKDTKTSHPHSAV